MPSSFTALNRDWLIRFDGLLLADLRDTHGLDLANIGGGAWLKMELDQSALTTAVCFLCREQLGAVTVKQLAESLCSETAEQALQAMWGAAKVFFRPKLWSALESACAQRRQVAELMEQLAPLAALTDNQNTPQELRDSVMGQMTLMMEAMLGSSPASEESPSATGQAVSLSKPAFNSPAPAESAPAA